MLLATGVYICIHTRRHIHTQARTEREKGFLTGTNFIPVVNQYYNFYYHSHSVFDFSCEQLRISILRGKLYYLMHFLILICFL